MLERNWNWRNNRIFCHVFVIGEITIRGGGCLLPFSYAYAPIEENKKGVHKFSARFLAFSNEISTVQKIVLSSSRGQANFRGLEASRPRPRTWGFEAKAKDFKMCPRGQGRPRGLHLWLLACISVLRNVWPTTGIFVLCILLRGSKCLWITLEWFSFNIIAVWRMFFCMAVRSWC